MCDVRLKTACCLCQAPTLIGRSPLMQVGLNFGCTDCLACGAKLHVTIVAPGQAVTTACTAERQAQHERIRFQLAQLAAWEDLRLPAEFAREPVLETL